MLKALLLALPLQMMQLLVLMIDLRSPHEPRRVRSAARRQLLHWACWRAPFCPWRSGLPLAMRELAALSLLMGRLHQWMWWPWVGSHWMLQWQMRSRALYRPCLLVMSAQLEPLEWREWRYLMRWACCWW